MRGLRFLIILLLSLGFLKTSGQTTFKKVDSTSYALYINKDWNQLVAFGEKAQENGFDYFYLNLRVGIAYFNLEEYKESKTYLEQANQKNSYNETVKEYLFWNNYHLLKEHKAKKWYAQLEGTTQQRIDYHPEKLIKSIFVESGQKFSNDKSVANNVSYFNASLQHHISGRINITQSYTYVAQKLTWGNFNQHQYYINPSYLINKTIKFNVAAHGAQYKSNLNYAWFGSFENTSSTSTYTPNPFPLPGGSTSITRIDSSVNSSYQLKGNYQENDLLIQPRITKEWEKFTISPYLSLYYSDKMPSFTENFADTTTVKTTTNNVLISDTTIITDSVNHLPSKNKNQIAFGTTVYFGNKKFTLGADIKVINYTDNNVFFLSPFIKVKVSKKVHLSAYYFKKKDYAIGLFEGSQLINSFDEVSKFSLTTQYDVSKKLNLYFTYQNESITDRVTTLKYKLNSIYLGLKLKF